LKQEIKYIIRKLTEWKDFVLPTLLKENPHTLHTFISTNGLLQYIF